MKLNSNLILFISIIVLEIMLTIRGVMPTEAIKDPLLLTFGAGVALIIETKINYEH